MKFQGHEIGPLDDGSGLSGKIFIQDGSALIITEDKVRIIRLGPGLGLQLGLQSRVGG